MASITTKYPQAQTTHIQKVQKARQSYLFGFSAFDKHCNSQEHFKLTEKTTQIGCKVVIGMTYVPRCGQQRQNTTTIWLHKLETETHRSKCT